MTGEQIVFGLLALMTLGAGIGMVSVRSIFHAALLMIVTFMGVAGLFVTLNAGFLGVVQVLVYIGAIAVLVLFAIMLTPKVMEENQSRFTEQWPVVAGMASLLALILFVVVMGTTWPVLDTLLPVPDDYAVEIGIAFMGPYLLPFEVASVVLLVALVGAIVIAREE
jgi:NADH:ubiquinone oxidoreductase subunit 6 (subunit J)